MPGCDLDTRPPESRSTDFMIPYPGRSSANSAISTCQSRALNGVVLSSPIVHPSAP